MNNNIEDKNKSINQKIDFLIEKLEKKEVKKVKGMKFNLPLDIKFRTKLIAKKNRALIFLLKTNRDIEIKIVPIFNGMVMLKDSATNMEKYYDARADCFYIYKGIPVLMLPEWSLVPIGTKDYQDAEQNKKLANAQQVIIRAIETKEMQLGPKLKMDMKTIIIIGIIAIIGFFAYTEYAKE